MHRSAWKGCSPKSVQRMLHSSALGSRSAFDLELVSNHR
jgi:hypothetical protein